MTPPARSAMAAPRLLNFGCGGTFHADWVNLDGLPTSPVVVKHDLGKRFPFGDGLFDAVYGSHVLEHFDPDAAVKLLEDCRRILKPGGVIRIVVPDLEGIVRLYSDCLEGALAGNREEQARYEWILLELFDQITRNATGGRMKCFLERELDGPMARFVAARMGEEGNPPALSSLERPILSARHEAN